MGNPNCLFQLPNLAKDDAYADYMTSNAIDPNEWAKDLLLDLPDPMPGCAASATWAGCGALASSGADVNEATNDLNIIAALLNIWSTDVAPYENEVAIQTQSLSTPHPQARISSSPAIMSTGQTSTVSNATSTTLPTVFDPLIDPNLTVVQPQKKLFPPGSEWCGEDKCRDGCVSLMNSDGLTPGWNLFSNTMPPPQQPNAVKDTAITKLHDYSQVSGLGSFNGFFFFLFEF
jgi:hypothetical protein